VREIRLFRIAAGFFVVFIIFLSFAGVIMYRSTAAAMKNQMGNKCLGIATAMAALIERDAGPYRRFIATLDTDSEYYQMLKANMEKIRFANKDNIAFIYAEVRVSDTEMMYIADGEIAGTDTYAEPGLKEPLTETRRIAYDTQAPYIGDFVTTVWGTLLSAYAPIFDPDNGDFIGIIGADVSVEQYNEIMNKQFFTITAGIAVLILTMLIMGGKLLVVYKQKLRSDANSASKSKFLARMSHEIRTPMNAIIGMSELAQREYGKPKALEYITGIKNAGASLLVIINDLLDFSKIESGNLPIITAPYETASLLNDVLTVIRARMAETPLQLTADISPKLPGRLLGDAGRVKQILLNLLSNAVKYTSKGFVKFSASGEPIAENAIRLTFIVEDSGIGIRDEDLAKLFGEFMRIDEKRNIGIEGTGLGLVIARNLCRAMGGDITAGSEYGKGSVFTAVLEQEVEVWDPMGGIEDIKAPRAALLRVTFTAQEADVLVADDFPSNLLVAEGLLLPYRMRVFTCLNGREAVDLVRERSFDLVLMDHMMPEMDGLEAVRRIRAMPEDRCRTMPIIALTANAVTGMKEIFLDNGFNDFLSKPVEIAKLDALLGKWIPAAKRRPAEEPADEPPEAGRDVLPRLQGVDAAVGLARVGGSCRRYMELLEMFRRDALAGLALLEREPDDQAPLSSFTTLAHALKSALANIGALRLSQTAALLEKAGREADLPALCRRLPLFREDLAALTAQIGEVTEEARSAAEGGQSAPEVRAALEQLRQALQERDIAGIYDAQARLQGLPARGETRAAADEIADCILMMEFKKAEEAVKGWLDNLS
jgi:signal transduction histidine kinase/CheY-like chemotaxis protein